MVGPSGYGMVYAEGLAGITCYMVWPGGHHMVYGMACCGMSLYVEMHSITCFMALTWAIVPLTCGVSWMVCSHVPEPFTSGHACSVHTFSSCSLWSGIVNKKIVNS